MSAEEFPCPSRYCDRVTSKQAINTVSTVWVSIVALLFTVTTILAISAAIDVAKSFVVGVETGQFKALTRDCGLPKNGEVMCAWRGTYTGTDGTTVKNALLGEDLSRESASEPQQVRWNGDEVNPVVYLDDPRSVWKNLAIIAFIWSVFTGLYAYLIISSLSRRRRKLERLGNSKP